MPALRVQIPQVGKRDVSWPYFLALCAPRIQRPDDDNELWSAFEFFDPRRTGQVDVGELRKILSSVGDAMSVEEFDEIGRMAGLPISGAIKYSELIAKVQSSVPRYVVTGAYFKTKKDKQDRRHREAGVGASQLADKAKKSPWNEANPGRPSLIDTVEASKINYDLRQRVDASLEFSRTGEQRR